MKCQEKKLTKSEIKKILLIKILCPSREETEKLKKMEEFWSDTCWTEPLDHTG